MILAGLGFLTVSDVKDVEVEVVCASFAGGVFLESPELFRALGQPCSVQRLSYSLSKSPTRLASSWISFFCSLEILSLFLVVVLFLSLSSRTKLKIKLSVSCLHVLRVGVVASWAEPISAFRFFVPLEGQSFLGPIQCDLFVVARGLLVVTDCRVCIA